MHTVVSMPRKPKLDALVVADLVYPGPGGKMIVIGTFNRWFVATVPGPFATVWGTAGVVYANVTELQGAFKLQIRVRRVDTEEVIAESPIGDGTSQSPLMSLEFAMGIPPLTFPAYGVYSVELVINGEVVGNKRMVVEKPQ